MIIKIPHLPDKSGRWGIFMKKSVDFYYLMERISHPLKELIRLGICVRRAITVMYTAKI